MRGKKSDLGRNDIKIWEIRSFWVRFSLKWGYFGQYTKLPETTMPPLTSFFIMGMSSLVKSMGENRH